MSLSGLVSQAGVSLPGSAGISARLLLNATKSTSQLHDNRPVSRDPGIAVPGFRLTGLRFFHAFAGSARLIKPARVQGIIQ